ncbi:unnamed protein product [Heterobilharzia americana]|nr:unnamed protein product [Heterobilharzia americana]
MSSSHMNTLRSDENKFSIEQCSIHVKNMEHAVGFLRGYISPILVIFGVFGNMSAFYLFLTHKPWNRFSIYVMIIAISDSLVLISNTFLDDFLGRGLYYLTNGQLMIKLDTYSLTTCRLMELTGCWFVFNSGCLLVAFSIDRVNCLFWPLKCRSNGGIGIASFVCGLIIFIGLLFSFPYAMLQKLIDKNITSTTTYTTISTDSMNSSIIDIKMHKYNHTLSHCSDGMLNCTTTNNNNYYYYYLNTFKSSSASLTCALGTDSQLGGKELLSFVFSTVLTYMVPCIILVFVNSIILIKLISIKTRRRILCKIDNTNAQIISWSSNGNSSLAQNDQNSSVTQVTSTMASLLKRRRHTILEDRRELGRVVALLLLSCFYLCFTFPVSISLTIRASLNDKHDKCVHILYAHLSRL